ncbi:ATP-binding cassette domain-containing protein, partial [Streptococcus pyogenes]
FNLFENLNVLENTIVAQTTVLKRERAEAEKIAKENLEKVGMGQPYWQAKPKQLSGGQKQRVAIATAIMQGTEIMVFDEPTANLDQAGIEAVKAYLCQLKAAGKTIIVAEHRLHYLTDLADAYFYFSQGRLTKTLTSEELLTLSDTDRQAMGLRSLDLSDVI